MTDLEHKPGGMLRHADRHPPPGASCVGTRVARWKRTLRVQDFQEGPWSDDPDALVFDEVQEVVVAAYEVGRTAYRLFDLRERCFASFASASASSCEGVGARGASVSLR